MPMRSKYSVTLPDCPVPTWLFGEPGASPTLPDTPLIIDPAHPSTRFLTLKSYRDHAQRLASGLRRAGLQTGDRLLLVSANSLAFPVVYMATAMAGGVFSPASANASADQIAYQACDAGCKFLLTGRDALANARAALSRAGMPVREAYLVDAEDLFNSDAKPATPSLDSRVKPWSVLLRDTRVPGSFDWTQYYTGPNQLVDLYYTSGSTGPPKGVMATHRNVIAMSAQFISMQQESPDYLSHTSSLRWVGWVPMAFVFGRTQFLLIGPKRGIPNYLMDAFDIELMMAYMEKYQATELFGNPPMVVAMANHPMTRQRKLSCLRSVQIGGAPLKRRICERFAEVVGNPGMKVQQAFGMTELTCIALHFHPDDAEPSDTVGELLPNCEARITSLDGATELGPNELGELWIRAPVVTLGYWRKPEQTSKVFMDDGWLRTGDLAVYDDRGKWKVLDRLRHLIQTEDGQQIVPSEVESLLLDIRGVVDACVVGTPSPVDASFQRPCAYVVLDEASGLTAQEVLKALRVLLPGQQRISGGLFAIAEIPKLTGTKVDRLKLINHEIQPLSRAMP